MHNTASVLLCWKVRFEAQRNTGNKNSHTPTTFFPLKVVGVCWGFTCKMEVPLGMQNKLEFK